jgi:phosphohistidine phosphatase
MATKSLFLLRHAKASAGGVLITDEDRPLSERGVKDAKTLGNKLHKKSYDFDLILTSPAIRSITTAQLLANRLGYKQKYILVDKHLYAANLDDLFKAISKIPKKIDSLMLVGHNPSISNLARHLAGEAVSMPTCALVELILEMKDWGQISETKASKLILLN